MKYNQAVLTRIVEILRNYPSILQALPEIRGVCGENVSGQSVRNALSRRGVVVNQILNSSHNYEYAATCWTSDQLYRAAQDLAQSDSVVDGLKKISKRVGRTVSGSSLRNAFATKNLKFSPVNFTRKDKNYKKNLASLKKEIAKEPKRSRYGVAGSPSAQRKTVRSSGSKEKLESYSDLVNDLVKYANARKRNGKKQSGRTLRDLCDKFDMSPSSMEALINEALHHGHRIVLKGDSVRIDLSVPQEQGLAKAHTEVCIPGSVSRELRVGVFSDTHYGSKYACKEQSKDFVNRCYNDYGVKVMLHAGDMFAGNRVYRGQAVELESWGLKDQVSICAETLPKFKDLEYYYILGNHDIDFIKESGADPSTEVAAVRDDMHCIGMLCETLEVPVKNRPTPFLIELAHIKSSAHARSYSLEKHIYRTVSRDNAPDVSFSGHRHTNGYFSVQGIDAFLVPCFEAPTYFARYGDYYPAIGGIIITFHFDQTGNSSFLDMTWVRYNDRVRSKPTVLSNRLTK